MAKKTSIKTASAESEQSRAFRKQVTQIANRACSFDFASSQSRLLVILDELKEWLLAAPAGQEFLGTIPLAIEANLLAARLGFDRSPMLRHNVKDECFTTIMVELHLPGGGPACSITMGGYLFDQKKEAYAGKVKELSDNDKKDVRFCLDRWSAAVKLTNSKDFRSDLTSKQVDVEMGVHAWLAEFMLATAPGIGTPGKPDVTEQTSVGKWTPPLSKDNLAARFLNRDKARWRDAQTQLSRYQLIQLDPPSGRKWRMRIDGMDDASQKRMMRKEAI